MANYDIYDSIPQNGSYSSYWSSAASAHPEWSTGQLANHSWTYGRNPYYTQGYDSGYYTAADILAAVEQGKLDPYTAQIYLSSGGRPYSMSAEQEKAFDNLLGRYNAQHETIWQKDQLQQIGLAASGVLQTGGVHTAQAKENVALSKYNAKLGLANSLIQTAGRMGAAGIHGAALTAVKGAASGAAIQLAHSAHRSVTHYNANGQMTGQMNEYKYWK